MSTARGPIFVVGAVRSGTTLMRLMLDSHPNIAIPGETGIMRAIQAQRQIPFWKLGGEWYGRLGLDDEEFLAQLRSFYGSLFERYAAANGATRWGEKTPWHLWHIERALEIWPDATFIAMVRHPGGNVGSLLGWGYSAKRSIGLWRRANREVIRRARALGDRMLVCRYEDLVLEPKATMGDVLEGLGEAWSDDVLRHHEVQQAKGAPPVVDGKTRTDQPIDPTRIAAWTERFDAEQISFMRNSTKGLCAFFDYSFDEPSRVRSISPPGSPRARVLDGSDVEARLAERPVTLEAPPVPMVDRPYLHGELTVKARDEG